MRFGPAFLIVGGLVGLTGCVGKYQSDFPIIVVNRLATNTIQVLANGNDIGQVAAGQTGSFSLKLSEMNQNVFTNGAAPTPQAEVTISAKDLKTGLLSLTKTVPLSQSSPTYVTFGIADFPVVAPTVSRFMSSPNNPGVNQDVFFNGSASTATNATYVWDFGDGSRGTGVSATHQYSAPGMYTVLLTVTSENGQSNTSSRTINVSANLPPTAAIFTFSPTQPAVNQDVTFATLTTVSGVRFVWDFGDGSSATGATVTHRYSRAATYTIMLRVTNDIGQSASSSRPLTVSSTSPQVVARFTFSPTTPGATEDVFFNAQSSTVDNGRFVWDFGDGSSGSGVTTTHQYARGGTSYTVTLTVTNDLGQTSTTTRTVPVSASTTVIVAAFTFSPTDPNISAGTNTVNFDATPSTPGVTTWTWDFGEGTGTGTGQKTSHTFSRSGTWVVRLTVTDAAGRTATTTNNVRVCGSISSMGVCLP